MNDVDALIAQARLQGFTVERRGSGHFLLHPPSRAGPLIVISSSPSDWRAVAKIRCQLKRAGLLLPADHTPPSHKGKKTMPRRTTTVTSPRTVASPTPTLNQADEARLARERYSRWEDRSLHLCSKTVHAGCPRTRLLSDPILVTDASRQKEAVRADR